MAEEKKKDGLLSRLKGGKSQDNPATDAGAKQPAAAPPKPASAPQQGVAETNAPVRERTEGEVNDPVASFQFYIESLMSIGNSHMKLADLVLGAVSENLAKLTGGQKPDQK